MALSMTLTQKQVEAMFARQSALRELGPTSYPLEIDFDENVRIYCFTLLFFLTYFIIENIHRKHRHELH